MRCNSGDMQLLGGFRREGDNLLNRLIAVEESWVWVCEPEFKWQSSEWCHPQSRRKHKSGKVNSADTTKNVLRPWGVGSVRASSLFFPVTFEVTTIWFRKGNSHFMGKHLQTGKVEYISASDDADGVFHRPRSLTSNGRQFRGLLWKLLTVCEGR
jgi:hypothetical protein